MTPEQFQHLPWYPVFKDFQDIIGALLGFTGVVITLWYNGHAARVQERRIRKQEANAIRSAIKAELSNLENDFQSNFGKLSEEGPPYLKIPVKHLADMYKTYLDRLYYLTPDEIAAIAMAYQVLDNVSAGICARRGTPPTEEEQKLGYITIMQEHFGILQSAAMAVLYHINAALTAIDKNLK